MKKNRFEFDNSKGEVLAGLLELPEDESAIRLRYRETWIPAYSMLMPIRFGNRLKT